MERRGRKENIYTVRFHVSALLILKFLYVSYDNYSPLTPRLETLLY